MTTKEKAISQFRIEKDALTAWSESRLSPGSSKQAPYVERAVEYGAMRARNLDLQAPCL